MADRVKVAFVDDHPMLLQGLSAILAAEPWLDVVAQGASADEMLEIAETYRPDVLITDLSMPGDVFGAISSIARTHPNTHVVVFTAYSGTESVLKALDAGATGFLLKGGRIEEVLESVTTVMHGELYITGQYAIQVLNTLRNKEARNRINDAARLSVREKQIIGCLMHARTNSEIAAELGISVKTVKYYMSGLMTKLNVRSRLEVVCAAQSNGNLDG